MSGANPPLGTFESDYGSRGTRGIRGGKSAKRKREAYIRWQESQGLDRSFVVPLNQAKRKKTPQNWLRTLRSS